MKRYLAIAVMAIGCIEPTAPTKVHPPLLQMPSDVDAPHADFTINCDEKVCLMDAQFSTSRFNEYPIRLYGWSFGDGSIHVTPIPSVQHTYKEKGIYNIMLTVWDEKDRGGRLYKTFEIK